MHSMREFPSHLEATNAFKRLSKRDVFVGIESVQRLCFPTVETIKSITVYTFLVDTTQQNWNTNPKTKIETTIFSGLFCAYPGP